MTASVDVHSVAAGHQIGDDKKTYTVFHRRRGVPGNGLNWIEDVSVARAATMVLLNDKLSRVEASFRYCEYLELIPHIGSVIEKLGSSREEEKPDAKRTRKPKFFRAAS